MIYNESIQVEDFLQLVQDKIDFYIKYRGPTLKNLAFDEYQELMKKMVSITNVLEYTLRFCPVESDESAERVNCNELLSDIASSERVPTLKIENEEANLPIVFCSKVRLEELFYSLLLHAANSQASTVKILYQNDSFIFEDDRQKHLIKEGGIKLFKRCNINKNKFLKGLPNLLIAVEILNFYNSDIEMKRSAKKTELRFAVPEWTKF